MSSRASHLTAPIPIGHTTVFNTIVQDLEGAGFAQGQQLMVADLLSSYWMFGDLQPLRNGAPWHYGGLPGFENADYLLVPLCPIETRSRQQILEAVEHSGVTLTEIRRTPLYILYRPG